MPACDASEARLTADCVVTKITFKVDSLCSVRAASATTEMRPCIHLGDGNTQRADDEVRDA